MKLTKFGHSCVLVEDMNNSVLFDPGGWSNKNLILSADRIDTVVYTHEHGDHFNVEILKKLVEKFPTLQIVCNQQIAELIEKNGIDVVMSEDSEIVIKFISSHEALPVPNVLAPAQNGYHFKDVFTHPGDSQSFAETNKILAMPFIGPWGKTGDSIAKVLELKPEYVLPIHDWHYTTEAKEWLQGLLESVFLEHGIKVLPNENGQVIEL